MRLQISRLRIARLMAAAFCVFCVAAVYAAQARPATTAKPAAAAAKASPESIANGETIYKRQCQMCHGATGAVFAREDDSRLLCRNTLFQLSEPVEHDVDLRGCRRLFDFFDHQKPLAV